MSENLSTARTFAARWRAADLDETVLAPFDAMLERVNALAVEARNDIGDARAERDAIITALARGEITLAEATERETLIKIRATASANGEGLVRSAQGRAATLAVDTIKALGNELITRHLAPASSASIATLVKANDKLPAGITDDAAAVRSGKVALDAWTTMVKATDHHFALVALADHLRRDRIVPSCTHALDEDYQWRNPRALSPRRNQASHLWLVAMIEAGAGPCILTAAEVAELRTERGEATVAPKRKHRQPPIRVRRDGSVDWEPQPQDAA